MSKLLIPGLMAFWIEKP